MREKQARAEATYPSVPADDVVPVAVPILAHPIPSESIYHGGQIVKLIGLKNAIMNGVVATVTTGVHVSGRVEVKTQDGHTHMVKTENLEPFVNFLD